MKSPLIRREVVADQSSAHRFARSFYHSLVSEQKYDMGGKQHVQNRILCKAAGCIDEQSKERVSNRTAQRLQMAARKSLETISGVILNRLQPKFAAKSVANEMQCLKAM